MRHTLQLLLTQCILVLVKIKESVRNRWRSGLVIWIVVWLQVRVAQGVFHRDALGGVEGQELFEQVQGQVVALGEERSEGDLLLKREGSDVLACSAGFDAVVVFHGWGAEDVQDQSELVVVYP